MQSGALYVDKTPYLKDLFLGHSIAKSPLFLLTDDPGHDGQPRVRIPSQEILARFAQKPGQIYNKDNPAWFARACRLPELLLKGRVQEAKALIDALPKQFISIRNSGSELYYHGFMLGLLGPAAARRLAELAEESEAGDGFPDLTLGDLDTGTAVTIEFKKAAPDNLSLEHCSKAALQRIESRQYANAFIALGCRRVLCLGIAFGGKSCGT